MQSGNAGDGETFDVVYLVLSGTTTASRCPDLLRGLVKREARDRLSCVSVLTPVPRPDCRQKLRRPNHRNLRFALGLFDNLGQREIQTEEKIATVVLRAPEMERIEQLVPVDFSFALIGPGNSLKFEKTLIFQRA